MQKQQAINIVHETFESAFDKVRFTNFIKNLLNEPDLTDGFGLRSGQYIPDAYKGYVEKYERLGKYEDEDEKRIDILIVHLKRETSIERARSMQRNFVAGYLQGRFGSDNQKDAALVAFVSPNGEDWRFSLVKLEVRLDASDEGKLKVTDEFTPAKRWSFLVGSQEKSHTAQRQFVPIMQDTDNNPTLVQLEEAFNIETVTKEFFNAYRELFIRTKGELDKLVKKDSKVKADFDRKDIDTVNLAKKLLGQIVFLYYLQKKGWFGVPRDAAWGEGSRAFLRELFEKKHGEYKNFFNDVLEPLFYEALRIDRSHDDHYYSRFDCKIPFLNGGLFDPMNNYDWVKTDLLLPNALFSNRTKDDPEGDGILDVFDLYNFTVKEDEPFEKEVAIDPELLGKAYEKFNAIRPDNYAEFLKALESGKKGDESKFNKQYGVYYTPREIVHYMCQQSLINYLYTELNPHHAHKGLGQGNLDMFGNAGKQGQLEITTEQAIEEIAKEDIVLLIQHGENWRENEEQVLAKGKETRDYKYKIPEPIRMNANLLDEKLAAIKVCDPAVGSGAFPVGMMSEIVKARQALLTYTKSKKTPYDFKRECIENSLYGVDIDSGAVEIAKLRLWLSLVVDEDDPQNIKPLPNLDYKIVCGNSLIGFPENWGSPIEKEIETLIHQHFDETNPKQKDKLKQQIDEKIESRYANSLRAFGYEVNFDFRTVFSEVFQKNSGFDVVIANPPYIDSERMSGEDLIDIRATVAKTYKLTKGNWDIYIAFFEKGFNLLNSKGTLAFITPDKWISKPFGDALRIAKVPNNLLAVLKAGRNVFEDAKVDAIVSIFTNTPQDKVYIYLYQSEVILKDTIQKNTLKPPFTLDALFSSGLDFIQKIDNLETRVSENFLCENACATSDAYKLKPLIANSKENKVDTANFFKIANTGTIGKYYSKWGMQPMVYLGDEYLRPVIKRTEFYKQFKNSYSQKTLRPKIIIKGLNLLDGFLDDDGTTIPGKTTLVIMHKNNDVEALKLLLALINSNVIFYYIKEKYSASSYNQGVTFTKDMINGIPLPKIEGSITKKITASIDRILAAKGTYPQADTSKEESAIDELVYQLYGLSPEEIAIVEGNK